MLQLLENKYQFHHQHQGIQYQLLHLVSHYQILFHKFLLHLN